MSIMTYKEWKRRTRSTLKPRSKPLRYLDAALKEYDVKRGSRPHFDALIYAFQAWAETKADMEGSERNKSGAVNDLLSQLAEFRDQHMPAAHRGGTSLRSNALLRDIKKGAKLLSEGGLKPQVKVHIPIGVKDTSKGTVIWEEFEDTQLQKARQAWSDAYDSAMLAVAGVQKIDSDPREEQRFQRWFGAPTAESVRTVRQGLEKLASTFRSSTVTIVLREDITLHLVNGNDPFGDLEDGPFSGSDVYGFVWHHDGGTGYRIIMGKWFLEDPDPIEGAAQTIYHELTHKVLKTVDHAYGKIKCRGFAATAQEKALTNADNWAFYAVSFKRWM